MLDTQLQTLEMDITGRDGTGQEELAGRQLEAAVLNKAATLLEQVQEGWAEDPDHAHLNNALKFNQALWSVFQAELMDDANPLPAQLRENILSLSSFVDRRIFEVMAYPEPGKLDIIIRINRSLADGLMAH